MSAVLDVDAFLQMLPETDVLRTHSESVKTAGVAVESVADSAGQVWGRLQGEGVYSAPGQETVFSAFAPILTRAGDVSTAAGELRLAINSYADEVDDIRRRFEAEVVPAAKGLAADTAGQHVTEWDDDGDLVDRHNAIVSQINRFVGELDAAQRACARALGRVRSGSKCEPGEPNGDPLGFALAYGKGAGLVPADAGPLTPAQLDSAAQTTDGLPWGRFVERDYGIHPFAKGILDQALAPVETYQTFTGKRGPMAMITATQGLFFTLGSLTGRNAAAAENRKQMLLQMAQVDLFKTDPMRAAGRLTFDLGSLLVPGGAVAKAGSAGRLPAKAGHVELPAPRLEVTVPPAPGIRAITEARPGLWDQMKQWADNHVARPEPAYPAGRVPGPHQFDVVHNEAPETRPGTGGGNGVPEGPPEYGVRIPDQSNPNGPGRDPAMQPKLGDSENGPGEWQLKTAAPQGRDYQEFITGVQHSDGKVPEYVLEYDKIDKETGQTVRAKVKMDGFYWEKGPPPVQVYPEAKGQYAFFETRLKSPPLYRTKLDEMVAQMNKQVDALLQSGANTRLDWHFLEQKVADDFFDLAVGDDRLGQLIEQGRIVIRCTPMD